MKIAFFIGNLNRGGMETLLADILEHQAEAPFEMICIYREEGSLSETIKSKGVPLFQLKPRHILDYSFYRKLRHLFLREKVDIVHAQHTLEALYAYIATRGTKIKIVQTFHGYDFNQTRKGALISRLMIKKTALNIFVSETEKRYFTEKYKLKCAARQAVVFNGIDFGKLNIASGSERKKESGSLSLGMVGNFVPGRDQMTVCRFLSLFKGSAIPFHFYFAGARSSQRPELYDDCVAFCEKNGLSEDVSFLGSCSDVPALLAQWDAFIYATDHDTFGIAVVEAMAAGVPVFVNDWEVMREITHNGEWATLYRTKDENDLLKHVEAFCRTREASARKAKETAGKVKEKYSISRHIHTLYQCYLGVNTRLR